MEEARIALVNKDLVEARRCLRQITRREPENYRAWMWLSGVTESRVASVQYAQRASDLAPNDESVQAALAWAKKRLAEAPPEEAAATPAQKVDSAESTPPPEPQIRGPRPAQPKPVESIASILETKPDAEPDKPKTKGGWLKRLGIGMLLFVLGLGALNVFVEAQPNARTLQERQAADATEQARRRGDLAQTTAVPTSTAIAVAVAQATNTPTPEPTATEKKS